MTLSYRKANALVHDTYFLSFKVFFRSLCEEKIHCVRARLSPERIILLFYSFESVTRFFMWFSSLPQQLDWIFILPNQVFWLLFNQTVGKNRRNQNQNNFFPRYNFRPQKSKKCYPHFRFNPERSFISTVLVEIDYFTKKNNANDEFNSDIMATEFQVRPVVPLTSFYKYPQNDIEIFLSMKLSFSLLFGRKQSSVN